MFFRFLCKFVENELFFEVFSGGQCFIEIFIDACILGQIFCCGINVFFFFLVDVVEKCVKFVLGLLGRIGFLFDVMGNVKGYYMLININ